MNNQRIATRLFRHLGCGLWLLLLLGWLTSGRALAAPAHQGPLPLPDLLIYGAVTDSAGNALEQGVVKVLRDGELLASAEIGAVAGTDYTYLLVVPMGMLPPGSTADAAGVAQAGDTLSFLVDDQPAYFQDAATNLTVNTLQIAAGAQGRGFALDLSLPGAMRFTLGDVNANGARNAADAMLALKYDIGLIIGVTTFPPGPNTVYLPLCDIVENGRCDSSDALRILQCDVGMNGVTCPVDTIPAGRSAQQPTPGAATRLRLAAAAGSEPETVEVRVQLAAGAAAFGAASFDLTYDPARFAPLACTADSGAAFDLVACNPAIAPGRVRFNAVAAAGATDGAEVVALRFQTRAAVEGELTAAFGLAVDGLIDVAGAEQPWDLHLAAAPATPAPPESTPDPNAAAGHQLYLPAVAAPDAQPAAPEPDPAPATEPAVEPAVEPAPAATPESTPPAAEAPAPPDEVAAPASHALFLPAIALGQATGADSAAAVTATVTVTITPAAGGSAAAPTPPDATAPAAPEPTAAPLPDAPLAALPPAEDEIAGPERPAQPALPDDE